MRPDGGDEGEGDAAGEPRGRTEMLKVFVGASGEAKLGARVEVRK